jgi:hypothetical protein
MKFLHTADWQIGMRAAHVGAAGTRVREERLSAALRVIDAARDAGAEFVVVCGDTFEDNGVDRVLVQKVADILGEFGGPVYVIPGNHDPFMPGSVWEHPAWRSSDNVCVLREETLIEVSVGTLFPCPAREQHSGKDPTAWIPVGDSRGIRVGLAHGTVEGVYQEEPDYPIPAMQRYGRGWTTSPLAIGTRRQRIRQPTGQSAWRTPVRTRRRSSANGIAGTY